MKYVLALLFQVCFLSAVVAQKGAVPVGPVYATVDKKAMQIPDSATHATMAIARYVAANLSGSADQTRAVFIWMASHIDYDVANMFAINFYEKSEEKIEKLLATHRGICDAFAATFQEILTKIGVKSVVVEGYTRQNGSADYIPHAWCAALVNGSWLLYDPTWGSGYVAGGKFSRKLNNAYFAAKPQSFIHSHMPFDYLWQFLYYPVTNQEFMKAKWRRTRRSLTSLSKILYECMKACRTVSKLEASARRIEAAGLKNAILFDRLHHIKTELEYDRQNKSVNLYNGAVADYNEGLQYYNDFVNYRNNQFKPTKPDAEIQAMLDAASSRLADARTKLQSVEKPQPSNATLILQLTKALDDADSHVREMQEWLSKYFGKSKIARKGMFYKVTWFGVPLN